MSSVEYHSIGSFLMLEKARLASQLTKWLAGGIDSWTLNGFIAINCLQFNKSRLFTARRPSDFRWSKPRSLTAKMLWVRPNEHHFLKQILSFETSREYIKIFIRDVHRAQALAPIVTGNG